MEHRHDGVNHPKVKQTNILGVYAESEVVKTSGDQTVNGVKTFGSIPVLPASDPTSNNQAARKSYVDNLIPGFEVIASDTVRDEANNSATLQSTYTKEKEIEFNEVDGKIRVVFTLTNGWPGTNNNITGRIYINGSAVGTERVANFTDVGSQSFEEDIDVENGDLVQFCGYEGSAGYSSVTSFKLKYDKVFQVTAGTVNDN